jgi:hypothetical protein
MSGTRQGAPPLGSVPGRCGRGGSQVGKLARPLLGVAIKEGHSYFDRTGLALPHLAVGVVSVGVF